MGDTSTHFIWGKDQANFEKKLNYLDSIKIVTTPKQLTNRLTKDDAIENPY